MWRTVVRLTPTSIIPIFSNQHPNDYDRLNNPTSVPQTGWDRVKKMYFRNEQEELSIELHNVGQSALCGAFFGACLGGFIHSRQAYLYFIENNQATIFTSAMEAKKKLQNHVTVAFAKGAYHWGWRLGTFTGLFSLLANTVSVYRGETSLTEYVTAGALTGGLYKSNLGLRATFVGTALGAVLSTIGGLAILGLLKVSGVSVHDIQIAMRTFKDNRADQYNQAIEKAATIKNDELTRHHDSIVKDKGEKTIEQL